MQNALLTNYLLSSHFERILYKRVGKRTLRAHCPQTRRTGQGQICAHWRGRARKDSRQQS